MLSVKYRYSYKAKAIKKHYSDIIYIIVCSLILASLINLSLPYIYSFVPQVYASITGQDINTVDTSIIKVIKPYDTRVNSLKGFLTAKSSPLAPYADLIIEQSDKYDIGWTQLVSVSGIESDYGKKIPEHSYNAWGLGGSTPIKFSSWNDSITYASWLFGVTYKLPQNRAIKVSYCPESSGCNSLWAETVTENSQEILAGIR